ncbi:hypothetical protein FHG87_000436 [Trinorchestia longiramus]|nr:hypothetical protein FHG87_000436 [Trinorchestia longiramus]
MLCIAKLIFITTLLLSSVFGTRDNTLLSKSKDGTERFTQNTSTEHVPATERQQDQFQQHALADYTALMATPSPARERLRLPGQELWCFCTNCPTKKCVTDGYCYSTITVNTSVGFHEIYE